MARAVASETSESPVELSPLAQLVTAAACDPEFAHRLFTDPDAALSILATNPNRTLGPGLPGPEFEVEPIRLTPAERRVVIAAHPRSLAQLARTVQRWEREHTAEPARDLLATTG